MNNDDSTDTNTNYKKILDILEKMQQDIDEIKKEILSIKTPGDYQDDELDEQYYQHNMKQCYVEKCEENQYTCCYSNFCKKHHDSICFDMGTI